MPKEIIVGEELIKIDPHNPQQLIKASIHSSSWKETIFEGGIGEFRDMLYRDNIITARTDKGWFFSKTNGISWFTEDEWRKQSELYANLAEQKTTWMSHLMRDYIMRNTELVSQKDPSLGEWLKEESPGYVELVELKTGEETETLLMETVKVLCQSEWKEVLFIHPMDQSEKVNQVIYEHYAKGEMLRKRKLLDRVINRSYLFPSFGFNPLFHFEHLMRISKMAYDVKTVILHDLSLFFKKDQSEDYTESVLQLLCEISEMMKIRLIVVINYEALKDIQLIRKVETFRHPFVERFNPVFSDNQEHGTHPNIQPKD
jgi:hypothetical protein